MARKIQQGILLFAIEQTEEPLVARGGLVVVYEMAQALGIPEAVDQELPSLRLRRTVATSRFSL